MNADTFPDRWISGGDLPDDWSLPEGWRIEATWTGNPSAFHVPDSLLTSPDDSRKRICGQLSGPPESQWELDESRIFSVPAETEISEIVKVFKVGSQGAISYGMPEQETMRIVAEKATKIAELFPCRVENAHRATLELSFSRKITTEDLSKFEEIFPDTEDSMQAGLEGYISEWGGEGSLFSPVVERQSFHFWWD